MELGACVVRWEKLLELQADGTLADVLVGEVECVDLWIPGAYWDSDSFIEYEETARVLAEVASLDPGLSAIHSGLVNENFSVPQDLSVVDCEVVAGVLSPQTVVAFNKQFEAADLTVAGTASIEYLEQWKTLISFAASKNAGVILFVS